MYFENLCPFIHSVSLCTVCDRRICKFFVTLPLGLWAIGPLGHRYRPSDLLWIEHTLYKIRIPLLSIHSHGSYKFPQCLQSFQIVTLDILSQWDSGVHGEMDPQLSLTWNPPRILYIIIFMRNRKWKLVNVRKMGIETRSIWL